MRGVVEADAEDRARLRDRSKQRHAGERVRLAVGGRAVAGGETIEHGAVREGDDLVAADLAGERLRGALGQEGGELHAGQARRITDFERTG